MCVCMYSNLDFTRREQWELIRLNKSEFDRQRAVRIIRLWPELKTNNNRFVGSHYYRDPVEIILRAVINNGSPSPPDKPSKIVVRKKPPEEQKKKKNQKNRSRPSCLPSPKSVRAAELLSCRLSKIIPKKQTEKMVSFFFLLFGVSL